MNDMYFEKLIKLSLKSLKSNDVPVAAIVVKNNKIIAKGYNKREKNKLTINHAEIIAVSKANKKLKNYFLYDCDIYVTLKPCNMCEQVINNARIRNVFYMLDKPDFKKNYEKTVITYQQSKYSKKYKKILQNFFNKLR